MKVARCYPVVKVPGQSYIGVKRTVVPNQSMSLAEIIRRFVRREALPIVKEGVYEERFGDLEKIAKSDITEQLEKVEQWKNQIREFQDRERAKREKAVTDRAKAEKDRFEAAVKAASTPVGGEPLKTPPLQGS